MHVQLVTPLGTRTGLEAGCDSKEGISSPLLLLVQHGLNCLQQIYITIVIKKKIEERASSGYNNCPQIGLN